MRSAYAPHPVGREDIREQLVNEGATGLIHEVSLPAERVTTLRGILFDLDPGLYRPGNGFFEPDAEPNRFHENIRPVLERHPLASKAEVRSSGRGLHVLLWITPPVQLNTAQEQSRWASAVTAVQRTLPVDPAAPGITALTRAPGSVNSRNGRTVEMLQPGQPVTAAELSEFLDALSCEPFRAVARILLGGTDRFAPCPLCKAEGTHFRALEKVGKCYGRCNTIRLADLFDVIFWQP